MTRVLTLALVLALPGAAHAQYGCNGFTPSYGNGSYSSSYSFRSAPVLQTAQSVDLASLLYLLRVLSAETYAASPFDFLQSQTFAAPPPRLLLPSFAPVFQSSYSFSGFAPVYGGGFRTLPVFLPSFGFRGGFQTLPVFGGFGAFPSINIRTSGGLLGRRTTDVRIGGGFGGFGSINVESGRRGLLGGGLLGGLLGGGRRDGFRAGGGFVAFGR